MRFLRPVFGLWLLVAALLISAAPLPALAHSGLLGSDPPDGALVEAAPKSLTLRFDESVRPLVARLTAPDGETILLDPPEIQGGELRYLLPEALGEGSHLLSWRVTSSDGHPIAGGTLFSIGRATGLSAESEPAPLATRIGVWAARALLTGALLFAAGGAVFAAFFGGGGSARRAAALGLSALPFAAGFQGLELLGLEPSGIFGPEPWRAAFAGPPGLALLLAGAALLTLAAAARPGRILAAAGLLLTVGAAAASGHAATASPQALMRPATALHVGAAALWIGALIPLWRSLASGDAAPLRRFSAAIPWGLGVLFCSGAALAAVQLARPEALWTTAYGKVLLAKLALVGGLLLIALVNRLRLTPLAEAGDPAPLRRSLLIETFLALLVIGVLSLWRFTPPPRSFKPPPADLVQTIASEGLSATLRISPGRAGPVSVFVADLALAGEPLTPLEAEIEFSKPAFGLGPFQRPLTPQEGGGYSAGALMLPMDGFWLVRLRILVSEFESRELLDVTEIAPAP